MVVVQCDTLNLSAIRTVVWVVFSPNLRLARAPGNVLLPAGSGGLPRDSVAVVSQIITFDQSLLTDFLGQISAAELQRVIAGIDVVLGREVKPSPAG